MSSKSWKRQLSEEQKKTEAELTKQLEFCYSATAIVLWDFHDWRVKKLERFFRICKDIWTECADQGTNKSMLQMLEEETGIELILDGYDSYHNYSWLDGTKWNGKAPTAPQLVYIRGQMRRWLPPMLIACVCLALHRYQKWGFQRLGLFVSQVDAVRQQWLGREAELYDRLRNEYKIEIEWHN